MKEKEELRLVVLARPGAALGFQLAGVPVVEAEPGREREALAAAMAMPRAGVLAADDDVLAAIPEDDRPRAPLPVVVPFALPRRATDEGRGRALVAELVRRAVGYHVKLGEGT
jgi:V/A-type H+-transporting ATPase subunit F